MSNWLSKCVRRIQGRLKRWAKFPIKRLFAISHTRFTSRYCFRCQNNVSRFNANHRKQHWMAVKRIFRYLRYFLSIRNYIIEGRTMAWSVILMPIGRVRLGDVRVWDIFLPEVVVSFHGTANCNEQLHYLLLKRNTWHFLRLHRRFYGSDNLS